MADDLADRISDGAVAVLELVPGEQRFADLSRFVLKGGASRFAPVVLDDEPIRYVLPVGVPGHKLDFGTLLIQQTRCALVWRTDPARPYHAMITTLGPDTTVKQSPATVRGDVWGRFDLRHPGTAHMTFLVPPVASAELPKMLHRVLVVEPRAQRGDFPTAPLAAEITENPRPAEPEVVVHHKAPAPSADTTSDADASGLFRPGRRRRTVVAEDHTQVLSALGSEDHTQVLAAVGGLDEPTQAHVPVDDDTASQRPVLDEDATQVLPAVDAPPSTPVPRPRRRDAKAARQGARDAVVTTPAPTPKPDALYRSDARPAPSAQRPRAQQPPAVAPNRRPAPVASARRDEVSTQVLPAATPAPQVAPGEPAPRSFIAEFIPGVLMGLAIVAVLGVLYFVAVSMGLLG